MPTTSSTINIAKVSQYLSAVDIMKGGLFGSKINENWDVDLYMERKAVEWASGQSATYENIYETTQYLYWLCYKTNKAQYIINSNTGGELAPVQSPDDCCIDLYPIYISASDLDEEGNYNNSDIVGDNVILFFNDNDEKWHRASADWFLFTPTGIRITAAYDETYTWVIQKLGNADATPTDNPNVVNYNLEADDTLIANVNATTDGQSITISIIPNGFTYYFDTNFLFGDTPPLQTPHDDGTMQIFTFQYIAAINKMLCVTQAINIPYS
jgi:hypothetical protein